MKGGSDNSGREEKMVDTILEVKSTRTVACAFGCGEWAMRLNSLKWLSDFPLGQLSSW